MTITAVIPIKQLSNAKQRLAGLLTASQRGGLFQAMVEDVLEAVTSCDRIDEVLVMTSDATVAGIAHGYGARVLPEPDQAGLIAAVTRAAEVLASEGVGTMIFLPGDVPLVSVEELEVVLDGAGQPSVPQANPEQGEFLIVPAADLGGSNCVVCSPPDCMTFGFGEDSFRRHLRLAESRGLVPVVINLPGMGLDVDTPDDLASLLSELERQGLQTHTRRFLEDSGVWARLTAGLAEAAGANHD